MHSAPPSCFVPPVCTARALSMESVTTRLLCIPVQSPYQCKTRGEEREYYPPSGAADVDHSPSMPWQDALPYTFAAVLDRHLFVPLLLPPQPHGCVVTDV